MLKKPEELAMELVRKSKGPASLLKIVADLIRARDEAVKEECAKVAKDPKVAPYVTMGAWADQIPYAMRNHLAQAIRSLKLEEE